MWENPTIPHGPLYDPRNKVRNFRFEEDFKNIRFNILGTGVLYKDPNFLYYLEDDKEWRRPKEICNRPIFINGKPDRFDALQGKLGDCWFVCGIEAITLNDILIEHVVPPDQSFDHNYIGAFHFRIWQLGTWYDVVVDDRLPVYKKNKRLCNVHSMRRNVFWAALLEKAYAKVCSMSTCSYDSLTEGYSMAGLQDLSGGMVEILETRNLSGFTLKRLMNEVFSKHALITCVCTKKQAGLVKFHEYTVTNVFTCSDDDPDYPGWFFVRILNPWGNTEWKGDWSDYDCDSWGRFDQEIRKKMNQISKDDGEFWMRDYDVVKYFNTIIICHLGPGQYIQSRYGPNLTSWRTTVFYGEWIKDISAGGSSVYGRHENPQYTIRLENDENDKNKDGKITVVIELVQKPKKGRLKKALIAFYMYSLGQLKNLPNPLGKQFFRNNYPINDPDFYAGDGTSYLTSMKLDPGLYCIVPCTYREYEESQFLLRVCSESSYEFWEYDNEISKSLPTEETSLNKYDYEGLRSTFDKVAQGQDKIDWIGLKKIIEKAMSSNIYYFKTVAPSVQFIRNFFKSFLSLWSFDHYETGELVFTKDECRSMIAMLDDNHSGKISFYELCQLWNKICFWTKVYEEHRDRKGTYEEGYLTVAQLRDALSAIGYNVSKRTVHSLSYVYENDEGNILLTDFILCGVTLETVLKYLHEKEHLGSRKKVTFTLEEWVKHTLIL